jgi:4-hydroxy-tetrahydrodipicolinate synthase
MTANFGAILTAMVTPFDSSGGLDEAAAIRLLHHLIENGSDGVVVCGTTGEAATMTDEEQLRMIELIIGEMRSSFPDATVIAGTGSNDTRHAVALTERVTELRPDALLSVNPYYNRPSHRGIIRHYEEIDRATDLPILLYNIPQRTGSDLPNELIARLAQLEHIVAVKQANHANLAPIEGVSIYAGNDDMVADVLDMGEPGGICTSTHILGREFRRMVDEPENRREIHNSLRDVFADMAIAPAACTNKAALNLLGIEVGEPRLPYVSLDDQETPVIRALLERHGLLQTAQA